MEEHLPKAVLEEVSEILAATHTTAFDDHYVDEFWVKKTRNKKSYFLFADKSINIAKTSVSRYCALFTHQPSKDCALLVSK